jgi:hypothetical protein
MYVAACGTRMLARCVQGKSDLSKLHNKARVVGGYMLNLYQACTKDRAESRLLRGWVWQFQRLCWHVASGHCKLT